MPDLLKLCTLPRSGRARVGNKHYVWQTLRLHQLVYSSFKKSPFEDVQETLKVFENPAFITPVRAFQS